MICYTCGKFIKRGHGKNIYWYAGQYRYYCFFCLKENAVSDRINQRRTSCLTWVIILTLLLSTFIYYLTIIFDNKYKPQFSRLALFLAVLPIIGAILLWQLKIEPKLKKLDEKDRELILKERVRMEQLENFIYSLKKGKEFCHCWKCLVLESEKKTKGVRKETNDINFLDDYYSNWNKKKTDRVQNDQLNSSLNEEQRKIFDLAIQGENIFFTGSAGTGKSFLLQKIISSLELLGKKVAVTAPTGVAAVNIDGTTIHSFSGIGTHGNVSSHEDLVKKITKQKSQRWVSNWNNNDILIIDEVSMLSGIIFDKLEYIARKVRKTNLPFGGLQLILTGDFFQLPPVNSNKLCFEAKNWNRVLSHTINLNKIYRQTEPKLINLLNEIRFGELSDESREILKNLKKEPDFPNDGIKATRLVSTNNEKDNINSFELSNIDGKIYTFKANDWEDKRHKGRLEILIKNCLAVEILELKRGSQVMLIKNLRNSSDELILVNGSQGIVINFDWKGYPIVRFTNGTTRVIKEEEWTDETPLYKIKRASRTQIPLILSWAITIHKSQGQSIERLKIDFSRVFEKGQTYVALSRACSLKYLQVIGFSEGKISCDEKVKKFYRKLLTTGK